MDDLVSSPYYDAFCRSNSSCLQHISWWGCCKCQVGVINIELAMAIYHIAQSETTQWGRIWSCPSTNRITFPPQAEVDQDEGQLQTSFRNVRFVMAPDLFMPVCR